MRIGGSPATLNTLEDAPGTDVERRTFEFVRHLCREAYQVTDDQVRQLVQDHGAENLTAIVLLVAYSNFQDRLFNSLAVAVEADGPLPPPLARFDWNQIKKQPPAVPEHRFLRSPRQQTVFPRT